MQNESIISVAQLVPLIKAAEELGVEGIRRNNTQEEVYAWMNDLLVRLRYQLLRKKEKGLVRRYLALYGGYSASHVDHLIARYQG